MKKNLFVSKKEAMEMPVEEWEAKGKPHLWVLEYEYKKDKIKVFSDAAYGTHIRVHIGRKVKMGVGEVQIDDKHIVFGSHYMEPIIPYRLYELME